MTIDEKRDALRDVCKSHTDCFEDNCPLKDECICNFRTLADHEIDRLYNIVFPTTEPTLKNIDDAVNHPSHYETGKYECIDVMIEALGADITKGFCLGNAFKYIYRCNKKHDSPIEDVNKARWYLDKYIELEKTDD